MPRRAPAAAPAVLGTLLLCALVGCGEREPAARRCAADLALAAPPADSIRCRLLLIGDAGLAGPGAPVLALLRDWAAEAPGRATVLFLGDLLYPDGLPPAEDPWRPEAKRILSAQIAAVLAAGARAVFLPGNHDLGKGPQAEAALARVRDFIESRGDGRLLFLPEPRSPGPAVLDLPGLRLVILDTPRWLATIGRTGEHPAGLLPALEAAIADAGAREVVVAGHHPPASHGNHGGHFPWRTRLFLLRELHPWLWAPTPVLGPLYAWGRQAGLLRQQDLNAPAYRRLRRSLAEAAGRAGRPLAFAGGHDHSLQVLAGGPTGFRWVLVSGAGSAAKIGPVGRGEDTEFARAAVGLMSLDVLHDGSVLLQVGEPESGAVFRALLRPPRGPGASPDAAIRLRAPIIWGSSVYARNLAPVMYASRGQEEAALRMAGQGAPIPA